VAIQKYLIKKAVPKRKVNNMVLLLL